MLLPCTVPVVVPFLLAIAAHAETLTGRVVAIADGDPLTIVDGFNKQHRIRPSGIDAPEKAQPFGERSKQNLGRLAFNRPALADCAKRDKYGRQVCVVRVNGADVALGQVAAGLAWWYRKCSTQKRRSCDGQTLAASCASAAYRWPNQRRQPPAKQLLAREDPWHRTLPSFAIT